MNTKIRGQKKLAITLFATLGVLTLIGGGAALYMAGQISMLKHPMVAFAAISYGGLITAICFSMKFYFDKLEVVEGIRMNAASQSAADYQRGVDGREGYPRGIASMTEGAVYRVLRVLSFDRSIIQIYCGDMPGEGRWYICKITDVRRMIELSKITAVIRRGKTVEFATGEGAERVFYT